MLSVRVRLFPLFDVFSTSDTVFAWDVFIARETLSACDVFSARETFSAF